MTKNLVFFSRIKYVYTKYHSVKTLIENNIIKPKYCAFEDQTSYIFTKPLGKINFTKLKDELGICKNKLSD